MATQSHLRWYIQGGTIFVWFGYHHCVANFLRTGVVNFIEGRMRKRNGHLLGMMYLHPTLQILQWEEDGFPSNLIIYCSKFIFISVAWCWFNFCRKCMVPFLLWSWKPSFYSQKQSCKVGRRWNKYPLSFMANRDLNLSFLSLNHQFNQHSAFWSFLGSFIVLWEEYCMLLSFRLGAKNNRIHAYKILSYCNCKT